MLTVPLEDIFKELHMQVISRRNFLRSSGLLMTSTAGWAWSAYSFPSGPELQFPIQPRERLAVSSWPFRAFIESPANRDRDPKQPGMDLTNFPETVVAHFDLHKIEPIGDHFRSTRPAYLESLNKAMEKVGTSIVNIPVSVGSSLYDL